MYPGSPSIPPSTSSPTSSPCRPVIRHIFPLHKSSGPRTGTSTAAKSETLCACKSQVPFGLFSHWRWGLLITEKWEKNTRNDTWEIHPGYGIPGKPLHSKNKDSERNPPDTSVVFSPTKTANHKGVGTHCSCLRNGISGKEIPSNPTTNFNPENFERKGKVHQHDIHHYL